MALTFNYIQQIWYEKYTLKILFRKLSYPNGFSLKTLSQDKKEAERSILRAQNNARFVVIA
jgi:hypothetical protein